MARRIIHMPYEAKRSTLLFLGFAVVAVANFGTQAWWREALSIVTAILSLLELFKAFRATRSAKN